MWWWVWWSRSGRVLFSLLWLASLAFLLIQRSAGALFLFEMACVVTTAIWFVPLALVAYRLYAQVRHPIPAGWRVTVAEISKELRSDWMQQVRDLGFNLAGYLKKDRDDGPCLALFVNSENRDSAHVSRVAGKDLLVFKTRFADGFAFETGNTTSAPLLPPIPDNPVFRFPLIGLPLDLYRVHERIRNQMGTERKPIVSDAEGEVDEFISRAEVVRGHMMRRDFRLTPRANRYVFTIPGAIRHAALLTWPVRPIREAILQRRALNKLTRLGFQIDRRTGRIVEQ